MSKETEKKDHEYTICYRAIGIIHSPFKEPKATPIQPAAAKGAEGVVEVFPKYAEGLKDLEGFSHIILVYHLHLIKGPKLIVRPFLDTQDRGVFATRAPARPNPIGISVVRLLRIDANLLSVANIDIIDKTPLLDIKPYVPQMDLPLDERGSEIKTGWLTERLKDLQTTRDDGRFISP